MIESKCPTCGSKTLLPDPTPPLTPEEKKAFREAWDARVDIGKKALSERVEEALFQTHTE